MTAKQKAKDKESLIHSGKQYRKRKNRRWYKPQKNKGHPLIAYAPIVICLALLALLLWR